MSEIKYVLKNVSPVRLFSLWVILFMTAGPLVSAACIVLAAASVCDIRDRIIPNIAPVCLMIIGTVKTLTSGFDGFLPALIGFGAAVLTLVVIKLIFRKGFGFGDVKLLASCGLLLSYSELLVAFAVACFGAAVAGLAVKRRLKADIALAPFIALSVVYFLFT